MVKVSFLPISFVVTATAATDAAAAAADSVVHSIRLCINNKASRIIKTRPPSQFHLSFAFCKYFLCPVFATLSLLLLLLVLLLLFLAFNAFVDSFSSLVITSITLDTKNEYNKCDIKIVRTNTGTVVMEWIINLFYILFSSRIE